jgi:SAM-dependent methyltransferase
VSDETMSDRHDYTKDVGLAEVRVRLGVLRERVARGGTVRHILEVGVGSGDATLMLVDAFLQHGGRITCVDTDADVLAAVRARLAARGLPQPDCVHAKAEAVDLPPASFDHVVLLNVLEHIQDPVAALERLRGCATADGRFHISVNIAGSLHRWLGVEMGIIDDVEQLSSSDHELGHHRIYTVPLLLAQLEAAGLRATDVHRFYLKPFPTSVLAQLPWETHAALDALGTRFPEFASYVYVQAQRRSPE